MSELTRCNFCVLEGVRARNPDLPVTTVPEDGWLRVYVNGEPIGISFLALTGECVC